MVPTRFSTKMKLFDEAHIVRVHKRNVLESLARIYTSGDNASLELFYVRSKPTQYSPWGHYHPWLLVCPFS